MGHKDQENASNDLSGPEVEAALAAIAGEKDPLRVAARLQRSLGEALGRQAAELHELRQRARHKLPHAARLLLSRKALEQATVHAVGRERARRIHALRPTDLVLDATAGIGGDAMALAACGQPLVAMDRELRTARFLRHNLGLAAPERRPWVVVGCAEAAPVSAELLLLDPDRRRAGAAATARGRARPSEDWSPTLPTALALAERHAGSCLKLPPTLDPAAAGLRWQGPHLWEWVSVAGDAKELTLWTGSLAEGSYGARRALVLASDGQAWRWPREAERAAGDRPPPLSVLSPEQARSVRVLAEPEPAIVRSGQLASLARAAGLRRMAPELPYLGGESLPEDPHLAPFLKAWCVRGSVPLDRRRVRELCRRFDVGKLIVKTRGAGQSAAEIARRMRAAGQRTGLLVALGLEGGRHAFLVEDPGAAVED